MSTGYQNHYAPTMNINDPLPGGFVMPGQGKRRRTRLSSSYEDRLPFLRLLPKSFRGHFVAMCGEFAGTFFFLFFAFSGTQVANTQDRTQSDDETTISTQAANPAQLLYIALCFGFSLAVNAWVFFRISGGLFNPAVTFGMCLVGALPYRRGGLILISQTVGAIAASGIVSALFPGPLNVQTTLGAGTSIVQGLFIEMFLTAQLVFTIFMLAAEKHKATFIAPVGIGLSLFIAELSGVFYTGGSLNPARSFGPCVVLHTFQGYHWIYWLGPILGALLASGFYKFIKMLEYETANPGQDFDEKEDAVYDPKIHGKERPSPIVHVQSNPSQMAQGSERPPTSTTGTTLGGGGQMRQVDGAADDIGEAGTASRTRSRSIGAMSWIHPLSGPQPVPPPQKTTEDLSYEAGPDVESGAAHELGTAGRA